MFPKDSLTDLLDFSLILIAKDFSFSSAIERMPSANIVISDELFLSCKNLHSVQNYTPIFRTHSLIKWLWY